MALRPGMVESINVARIQEIKNRDPKACGFQEVAPSTWVRIDCHAYQPSTKAISHLSARKAKGIQNRTVQWKPFKNFSLALKANVKGFGRSGGGLDKGTVGGPGGAADGPVKAESFPGTVDHRTDNLEGPIKDQGPVGACTAFSLSTTIDNAAIRAGKMAAGNGDQATSANHVWSGYGYPQMGVAADSSLGRSLGTMATWGQSHSESCKIANAVIGDCGVSVNPPVVAGTWRSDPAIVAKFDRANAAGAYKIASFEKLDTLPAKTDELVYALAGGSDLWIAMKIDGYAWSNGKMKNAVIPDWDDPSGGHAVTMSGYRDTPTGKQFLIHNSWGKSWGDQGYAWVSERMVHKFMHYAYKVKISDGVKKEDMTDDDCAPDELLDLSTGFCGLICPDDTRPNGGCKK